MHIRSYRQSGMGQSPLSFVSQPLIGINAGSAHRNRDRDGLHLSPSFRYHLTSRVIASTLVRPSAKTGVSQIPVAPRKRGRIRIPNTVKTNPRAIDNIREFPAFSREVKNIEEMIPIGMNSRAMLTKRLISIVIDKVSG